MALLVHVDAMMPWPIPRPFGRLPSESKTKRPGKWFSSRSNRCAMGLVDMALLELNGIKDDAKSCDIL